MNRPIGSLIAIIGLLALTGAACGRTATNITPTPTNTTTDNQSTTPPEVTPAAKIVTVSYTGTGFSPSSVTVNAGDTVKFINTGQTSAVWPAVNPHPVHTSVPGFDAGKPLASGGTYSFTFTARGTFGYHNHLNPAQTGTIVVQ
ncbi:TPA: hypothetical protein DHW58_02385 [Patescibacteria group bacterium]|uniref:Plastocyanin n=2 Tax=Bacteria division Kazan-3B-28 TaxID=1798534 RepID=A0A0G2A3Q6_UNCK3|nr:MAG: Plastocyanin [candidate division Kazan bacterium GW2011_GWA1_50_15]KKW25538.1 MAG: Plastocyanin [candidate division Kazan bacterium GW2011_GWC1_52_13]KKW26844.1 MAG: Plastocyanin [candidate division Kazan bacterium GW2011_GWB1_52_7]HAV65837.1 hypothetical protein [Patescibacteria group bacterium]HCL47817.1 hypothetical protein [Patescibacteria group bacterium]